MPRPSACAARRFTTSSKVVGCWIGKSAGRAPRRFGPRSRPNSAGTCAGSDRTTTARLARRRHGRAKWPGCGDATRTWRAAPSRCLQSATRARPAIGRAAPNRVAALCPSPRRPGSAGSSSRCPGCVPPAVPHRVAPCRLSRPRARRAGGDPEPLRSARLRQALQEPARHRIALQVEGDDGHCPGNRIRGSQRRWPGGIDHVDRQGRKLASERRQPVRLPAGRSMQ